MVSSLEDESLFESLGLTPSQVRVYLALVYSGPSKVSQLSKNSGIHRTHLYQILRSLESSGLVEKNLVDGYFKSTPLKDALEMVICRKHQELKKIEAAAKAMNDFSKPNSVLENKPELLLFTNKIQISKKINQCFEQSKKTICLMQTWTRFLQFWDLYSGTFLDAMNRGVTIKQVVTFPENKLQKLSINIKSCLNPRFDLKFVSKIGGNYAIFDDEKVLMNTCVEKRLLGDAPLLFSNYPGLIETVRVYFDLTWASGSCWNEL